MKKNKIVNSSCTYLALILLFNLPAAWLAGWSLYFALMQAYKKKLLKRYYNDHVSGNLRRELFCNTIKIRAPNP